MIVLDSNVVSELISDRPHQPVVDWFETVGASPVGVTTVSVLEVRYGILRLPPGRRRKSLSERLDDLCQDSALEILPFDLAAAEAAAVYLAERERRGRRLGDYRDAQIAGITISLERRDGRQATLATRNIADFIDLQVVNPWDY